MPKPRILGIRKPYTQSVEIAYDPTQGVTTTTEWAGVSESLGGLASTYQNNGVPFRYRMAPIRSTLVATESRNNFIADSALERWELLTNQNQLDIREHPRSVALGQSNLAQVLRDVKKHEDGRAVDTSGYSASQLALFNLMIRGVTHYSVWQWVLRYTANVSNTYDLFTAANSGLGTIYSTSSLGLPGGRLASTLDNISAPDSDSELTWGWLKIAYSEVQAPRGRVDVSSEFHLAQWSNYLYA